MSAATTQRKARARSRTSRFQVRATPFQEALIRRVAETRGVTVTDFLLQSAFAEAQAALSDQQSFLLASEDWQRFLAVLDRPVQEKPRLRRLFAEKTILE